MPEELNNLQLNGQDLLFEGQVITFNGAPEPECNPRYDMHAYGNECGEKRFRRLRLLGYL